MNDTVSRLMSAEVGFSADAKRCVRNERMKLQSATEIAYPDLFNRARDFGHRVGTEVRTTGWVKADEIIKLRASCFILALNLRPAPDAPGRRTAFRVPHRSAPRRDVHRIDGGNSMKYLNYRLNMGCAECAAPATELLVKQNGVLEPLCSLHANLRHLQTADAIFARAAVDGGALEILTPASLYCDILFGAGSDELDAYYDAILKQEGTRVSSVPDTQDWTALGVALKAAAHDAYPGEPLPPLQIAWSFLLANPACFGNGEEPWPADMPATAPDEVRAMWVRDAEPSEEDDEDGEIRRSPRTSTTCRGFGRALRRIDDDA